MIREYTVNTKEQVLMYLNTTLKPNEVTEAPSIALNKWAWNDELGFHYNVGNTMAGTLALSLGKLNGGERVDVYAEVMVISGKTPVLSFNNPSVSTINYTSENKVVYGGFNPIKLSSYNDVFEFRGVTVGLATALIGEGYIRNIRVVVTPKVTSLPLITIPFVIRNPALGSFEEWKTASNNLASVTLDTPNNKLILKFKRLIREEQYFRPIVTTGNDENDNGVYWKVSATLFDGISIQPFKRSDNTVASLATLTPYTYALFQVTYTPKDHDWTY